jgi:IS1 family transposase/transposase-like protein
MENCLKCSSKLIKYGKNTTGKQKYKCINCKRCSLKSYTYKACYPEISQFILSHLKESCSVRGIARLANISTTTVVNRIKSLSRNIKPPLMRFGRSYELDEMRTYVGNKDNIYWVIYAIDKLTKEIVLLRVGKRNKTTVKKVTDLLLLSNPKEIYTDKLGLYKTLIPSYIHKTKKGGINHIERKNLTLRTHIKRLSRRNTINRNRKGTFIVNTILTTTNK